MMTDGPEKIWAEEIGTATKGGQSFRIGRWITDESVSHPYEYVRADILADALEANARLRAALDNAFLAIVEARSYADPGPLFRVLNEILGKVDDIRRAALVQP